MKQKITKEDIKMVAKTLKVKLTPKEVTQVLRMYPYEQEQDPTGNWSEVAENCIGQVVEIPLIKNDKVENLKISIDNESINIYIDNSEDKEPTHVVYWHLDEVKEDASVAISIANAIHLFYTNPKGLLKRINFKK